MKVFGIGLSRTGTTSLHLALVLLGIPSVHYPSVSGAQWLNGDFRQSTTSEFDGYTDIPTGLFFRELHSAHPDAKFVYTRRNRESWLQSCERHFGGRPVKNISQYGQYARLATYGVLDFNRERFSNVFDVHDRQVRDYFADYPAQLLTVDLDAGPTMEALSSFLGISSKIKGWPSIGTPSIGKFASVKADEISERREELIETLNPNSKKDK